MKIKYYLKIFLPLLLICAVIAGVVSGVHELTKSKIENNLSLLEAEKNAKKLEVIASVYGDMQFVTLDNTPDGIDEIRRSSTGEYCVTVTCDGYNKSSIQLFAAFSAELEIKKIVILSSNETKDIGTKVNDPNYLSQYIGKSGQLIIKDDIDKIAGATLSSKAVLNGVNKAYIAISKLEAK